MLYINGENKNDRFERYTVDRVWHGRYTRARRVLRRLRAIAFLCGTYVTQTKQIKRTNAMIRNLHRFPWLSTIWITKRVHDLMKTGHFLEIIFLLCLNDDLMDLLRYDELDLVFKVPRTFESRSRGNQNLKRRKLVLNSENDIRLFILSFVRLFFLLLFSILKQQEWIKRTCKNIENIDIKIGILRNICRITIINFPMIYQTFLAKMHEGASRRTAMSTFFIRLEKIYCFKHVAGCSLKRVGTLIDI